MINLKKLFEKGEREKKKRLSPDDLERMARERIDEAERLRRERFYRIDHEIRERLAEGNFLMDDRGGIKMIRVCLHHISYDLARQFLAEEGYKEVHVDVDLFNHSNITFNLPVPPRKDPDGQRTGD